MPKVSFYLRNEDVEAWKAIDKKTEFIHAALNNTAPDVIRTAMELGALAERQVTRSPVLPTKSGMFERSETKFCKHEAVLGMCKKGCK